MTLHVLKSLQNGILRMYPSVVYRVSFSVQVQASPSDTAAARRSKHRACKWLRRQTVIL